MSDPRIELVTIYLRSTSWVDPEDTHSLPRRHAVALGNHSRFRGIGANAVGFQ